MKTNDKVEGLPDLTDKQFAFVQHRAAGKSQVEAWKLAYGKSDSDVANPAQAAFKVASLTKIRSWLATLKLESVTLASITRDRWVEMILETIQDAREAGAWSPAVNGLKAVQNAIGAESFADQRSQDDKLLDDIEKAFGREARERTAKDMGYQDKTLN